jgi:hypothetical protein
LAETSDPRILSFLALRRTVGAVSIGLPVVLASWGYGVLGGVKPSMSQFYYTDMRDIFVGSLLVIGVFLLAYRGYDKTPDEKISDVCLMRIAGVSVILVALLPTNPICPLPGCNEACIIHPVRGVVHLVAAGVFLAAIGVVSFAKFSRTRNARMKAVYKGLGAVTLGALAIMAALFVPFINALWPNRPETLTFWLETVAVVAFGLAWLAKGKTTEGVKRLLGRGR